MHGYAQSETTAQIRSEDPIKKSLFLDRRPAMTTVFQGLHSQEAAMHLPSIKLLFQDLPQLMQPQQLKPHTSYLQEDNEHLPTLIPSEIQHPIQSETIPVCPVPVYPAMSSAVSSTVSPTVSTTSPVRRYRCKTCARSFTTSGHLARHTRIHTGERKYVCPHEDCKARFSRQDNCMQHFKTHTNSVKRKRSVGK